MLHTAHCLWAGPDQAALEPVQRACPGKRYTLHMWSGQLCPPHAAHSGPKAHSAWITQSCTGRALPTEHWPDTLRGTSQLQHRLHTHPRLTYYTANNTYPVSAWGPEHGTMWACELHPVLQARDPGGRSWSSPQTSPASLIQPMGLDEFATPDLKQGNYQMNKKFGFPVNYNADRAMASVLPQRLKTFWRLLFTSWLYPAYSVSVILRIFRRK